MIMNASHTARPPRVPVGSLTAIALGRPPEHDDRWPLTADALNVLREAGRHSVRIVDADCGTGALLIHAVQYARSLDFTTIEGRGIDGAPALIARARLAAARLHDPAVGLRFDAVDLLVALEEEAEFPADILLWGGKPAAFEQRTVVEAASTAAHVVLIDCAHLGGARDGRA